MLFNSIDFAIFLPITFILYWFVAQRSLKLQNAYLVLISYIFYGWWDWRFLTLIIFSTLVDFFIGKKLNLTFNDRKRRLLVIISLVSNLGILGFFKYYNFFLDNFIVAFSFFGADIPARSLNIILPVGISFYTFQTLSYTIDIYRRKMSPTNSIIDFAGYVSFFPQLVAGPIERASRLLPQFQKARVFEYSKAVDGLRQIIWGLFKKVVIADNCAEYANLIFNNSADHSGSTLFLGAIFFAFQIYGDFSGYSDIAIGTARLFGFNLMKNFAFPYFSRDIAEFWRRWHISLSTWFRDYLYIPLGGSRGGNQMRIRNTFIIFIVSGFWHGANWTFIVWGALNALYFLPLLLTNKNRTNLDVVAQGKIFPGLRDLFAMTSTFLLTVLAWIFFRANNLTQAMEILSEIFSDSLFTIPTYQNIGASITVIILIGLFMIIEWMGRDKEYAIEGLKNMRSLPLKYTITIMIVFVIIVFMSTGEQEFIYFQF